MTETFPNAVNGSPDILALGQWVDAQVAEQWETVLDTHREKLADAYARAGDMAFGTYLNLLLRDVKRHMRDLGLKATPPLPGDFDISREWGNADGTDNERWMWSLVTTTSGEALGTLVLSIPHDHTRFRLPRPPHVFALRETERAGVEAALSARSSDFARALPFHEEYAEYLRGQETEA
ncbi:DUF6022 family protein [Deinococcus sp. YIM 134068]|uniref:DUF6022 family protein n=1 Tax=Deinococcus lichenicola TaxID=3118910 RepID=UPI002F9308DB